MSSKKEHNIDDFLLLRVIGKGCFGKIILVREIGTDKIYAMKVLKKKLLQKQNKVQNIFTERSLLTEFSHPFIIKILSTFQNQKKLYFILQHCPGGELFNLLIMKQKLSQEQCKFYVSQIILALDYMHSQGVVYRDLKPENVLIDAFGNLKLTDFGLSKKIKHNEPSCFSMSGMPEYMAPQIILGRQCNKAVDFWCLASMMYEMLTGHLPFYAENLNQMYQKIINQPFAPDKDSNMSEDCLDLIMGLFHKEPSKRIGVINIEELKSHSWFKGIDWNAVYQRKYRAPFIPILDSQQDIKYFSSEITSQSINSVSSAYSTNPVSEKQEMYEGFDFSGDNQ